MIKFLKKIIKTLLFTDNPLLIATDQYLKRSRKEVAEVLSKL